jgi:hypothetical protein
MRGRGFEALLLVSTLSACDTAPSIPGNRAGAQAGWQAAADTESGEFRFVDEDFVLEIETPARCPAAGPLSPARSMKRISVPVMVRGLGARRVPVGPLTLSLEDPDGHVYRATLAGCAPGLPTRRVTGGETASGAVSFDVPELFQRGELVYEPFIVGRKPIRARIKTEADSQRTQPPTQVP